VPLSVPRGADRWGRIAKGPLSMRVGIDASNLRGGGGITHLRALIGSTDPLRDGIERITVWGSRKTLDELPERPWLDPIHEPELDGSLFSRTRWRHRRLPKLAAASCDILLAPGGSCTARFRPVVAMSRNLLPFEFREMFRFAPSRIFWRTLLLRGTLSRSFRRADGMIFLTEHAPRAECDRDIVGQDDDHLTRNRQEILSGTAAATADVGLFIQQAAANPVFLDHRSLQAPVGGCAGRGEASEGGLSGHARTRGTEVSPRLSSRRNGDSGE
jgi:hypothetical protein